MVSALREVALEDCDAEGDLRLCLHLYLLCLLLFERLVT